MARIDGLRGYGRGNNQFPQAWQLYPLLKDHGLMRVESHLVDEGGSCGIGGVLITIISKEDARIDAKARKRSFVHRVFAECDCGKQIPFGRLQQHRNACTANVFEPLPQFIAPSGMGC